MEFGDATLSLTLTNRIIQLNGGKPPLTYSHFIEIVSDMPPPPVPVPALHARMLGKSSSPISEDHDEKYGVPTLTELGKIRQECLLAKVLQALAPFSTQPSSVLVAFNFIEATSEP